MSTSITDIDTSKLSWHEMLALAEKLTQEAEKEAQKEFDSTINFLNEKLPKMGRTKTQAVQALVTLMDDAERRQCMRLLKPGVAVRAQPNGRGLKPVGLGKKKDPSQFADWDGESRAVVGKTYALPDNPAIVYTRQPIGPVRKPFMEAVRGGAKWREMEVRSH